MTLRPIIFFVLGIGFWASAASAQNTETNPLQQQLEGIEELNRQLSENIQRLQPLAARIDEERNAEKSELAALRADRDRLANMVEVLRADLARKAAMVDHQQAAVEAYKDQTAALRAEMDALRNALRTLQTERDAAFLERVRATDAAQAAEAEQIEAENQQPFPEDGEFTLVIDYPAIPTAETSVEFQDMVTALSAQFEQHQVEHNVSGFLANVFHIQSKFVEAAVLAEKLATERGYSISRAHWADAED